MKAMLWIISI